ncbi:stage II sporulation protein P [Clostridium boliviensis]|uniref:Stage II sporulation protein P n=1 Tax=Clostridium boliviensis TaxID=318465 RepID=A0ABU4GP26_9CLOT|nr:stage II sporulation protein P [Clostridium boliviensis]MDW2799354.1 stage II sporulation protein P [Clostridium boliviensis]
MRQSSDKLNRFIKKLMIAVILFLAAFLSLKEAAQAAGRLDLKDIQNWVGEGIADSVSLIWHSQYPAASWELEGENGEALYQEKSLGSLFCGFFFSHSPLSRYTGGSRKTADYYGESDPAYISYLESGKFYEEHSFLLYNGGEESGEDGSVNAGTHKAQPETQESGAADSSKQDSVPVTQPEVPVNTDKNSAMTCASSSIWPIVGTTYRKAQLADYDYMMKHFYSVHTSTTAGRDLMKADQFLSENFTLEGGNDKPQILIYHTHSQEEYSDFGPGNKEATVVGIGTYLTKLLTAKGYNVIHDTSVYDLQNGKLDRNKAYTYALDGITGILQKNPSIEVIMDIHRDGVNSDLHMVNKVNGKMTAPIMFFNGVCQTPEGPIEYLPNPYREKNLAFSFQMQLDSAAYFPGLTRKIYIKGLRYNQHLRARSTLIEVGAQTNSYQEALNAMEPLSEVLDMVLKGN